MERAREHWAGQVISSKSAEFKSSSHFIEKALSNGTRVIVVETPLSQTAAQFATAEYLAGRKEVVLALLNDNNAYMQYPKVLPDRFLTITVMPMCAGKKYISSGLRPNLQENSRRIDRCRKCQFFFLHLPQQHS